MKRLLAMLLCLCLTVLLLASCSSDLTLEDYIDMMKNNAEKAPVFGEMNEITQLSGKTFVSNSGNLLLFTSIDNTYTRYTVFDAVNNDVVFERTNSDTTTYQFAFKTIYGNTFFTVKETMTPAVGDTTYKTTIYDSLGEVVAAADKIADITYSFDLFEFDDAIYRVSLGGAVTVLKEKNAFNQSLKQFTAANEKYYYCTSGYSSDKSVSVYDKELNFVSYWEQPSNGSNVAVNYLSNGDILAQVEITLPADEADYDYYNNGNKYDLHSYLIDPASGEAEEIDLDYCVTMTVPNGFMSQVGSKVNTIVPEKIDNMALVSYIKEKALVLNSTNVKLVVIGNDAKIKGDVFPELKNFSGDSFMNISEDLCVYSTKDGRTVICNAKGETLGYGDIGGSFNQCYFVKEDKIYNHKLELIVDCTAEKLSVVHLFNRTVLVKDENNVYKLLADGELKTVSPAEGVFAIVNMDNGYYTVSDGTALAVYNEYGDKIKTISTLSVTAGVSKLAIFDNGAVLVKGTDAATGLSVYYLIEAASAPAVE